MAMLLSFPKSRWVRTPAMVAEQEASKRLAIHNATIAANRAAAESIFDFDKIIDRTFDKYYGEKMPCFTEF